MTYPFSFGNTARPKTTVASIENFRGDDLRNTAATVDKTRSPESLNMIRDEIGQVRKRMGYYLVKSYSGQINGAHKFNDDLLIHAGDKLYKGDTVIGTLDNARSQSWLLNGKLYLLDGAKFRIYDGETLSDVAGHGYIPTTIISRNPDGSGGSAYEEINLLEPGFTNSFYLSEAATVFQLTDDSLDSKTVTAKIMNSSGTWVDKTEGTHFSVNRTTGVVTFSSSVPASPLDGEDNVKITAYKTRTGYADKINKCTISTLFGVNGAADRLFLAGHPDYPNQDRYSQMNDPTYFGDLSYSVLGQDNSAIMGYSIIADRLAAHKDDSEDGRNVILRSGLLTADGEATFPIVSSLQGEGCNCKQGCAYLGREPLFVTRNGIYAITAEDITGEKYSQNRSGFLNSKMINENLADAVCCVFNDFYFLAVPSGRVYVLDSLQKTYSKNEPYSTFQYEGYVLDNINARVMWADDATLYFGDSAGSVWAFYKDKSDPNSFNDNGMAIKAYWDTPYFSGKVIHNKKKFTYMSLTLAPAPQTGVRVYGKVKGLWKVLFEDFVTARYFDFKYLDFSKFTFSTDASPINIKKELDVQFVDKLMFRLENDALNEPFGIYDLSVEFMEGGHF